MSDTKPGVQELLNAALQAHQILRAMADQWTGPLRIVVAAEDVLDALDEAIEAVRGWYR